MRPNPLPLATRLRSNLLQAPPFLLGTAFFGSLSLLASTWDKSGDLQHRIARIWAKTSIFLSGSKLKVIGLENIPHSGSIDRAEGGLSKTECCVFAANHTSYMDTPVVFASLPFQFRILAKKELWTIPFIGWYLNRSGQLPIDTENPRATLSSLGAAVKTLRHGLSVFVFPEGGRTPDGCLQPFLNGAAYLAIRAQVRILPIALIGVRDLLPMHSHHFWNGPVPLKLVIGKPIETIGLTVRDSESLSERLKESIAQLIETHASAF